MFHLDLALIQCEQVIRNLRVLQVNQIKQRKIVILPKKLIFNKFLLNN